MQTPEYNLKDFPDVYEPSEDTFLFLDALEMDLDRIKTLKPLNIVEIGSGSGVVISYIAKGLGNVCNYFSTDINSQACRATQKTALLNDTNVECLNMNLLENFKRNMFDIILFNPPYVVTDEDEMSGLGLNRSWAGGKHGREIIDKFLQILNSNLTTNGLCYMVVINENKPWEIQNCMKQIGYLTTIVTERRIRGEHLFILKFSRE